MDNYTDFFAAIGMLATFVFGIYFVGFFISSMLCLPYYIFGKKNPAVKPTRTESISSPKNTLVFIFTIIGLIILTAIIAYFPSSVANFALAIFGALALLPPFLRKKSNLVSNITIDETVIPEPLPDETLTKIGNFQQKIWDAIFSLCIIMAFIGTTALILYTLAVPPNAAAPLIATFFSSIVLFFAMLYAAHVCILGILKNPEDANVRALHAVQKKIASLTVWGSLTAIHRKLVFLWKYAASILSVYVVWYFIVNYLIFTDYKKDIIKEGLQDLVYMDFTHFLLEIQQLQFFLGAGLIFFFNLFIIVQTLRGRSIEYRKYYRHLVAFSFLQIILIFVYGGFQDRFYPMWNPRAEISFQDIRPIEGLDIPQ